MNKKIKLAIIEDNTDYLDILCDYFGKTESFRLVGVSRSAFQGLEIIKDKTPDIVLLDIVIPEYDGFWLLETLKEQQTKHKPACIMMTSATNEMVTRQVMDLGAKYIFVKPFKLSDLERRLVQIAKYHFETMDEYADLYGEKEKRSMETEISVILNRLGVSINLKGFQYLKRALILCVDNRAYLNTVSKKLYVQIANEFETTPESVERAVRHAIDSSWKKDRGKSFNEVFTYMKSTNKPSNKQFITLFVENYNL